MNHRNIFRICYKGHPELGLYITAMTFKERMDPLLNSLKKEEPLSKEKIKYKDCRHFQHPASFRLRRPGASEDPLLRWNLLQRFGRNSRGFLFHRNYTDYDPKRNCNIEKRLVFGFSSMSQLVRWFNPKEMAELKSYGFEIIRIRVPEKDILDGFYQCAFYIQIINPKITEHLHNNLKTKQI